MTTVDVFISYALADEALRKRLEVHLQGMVRQALIRPWHVGNVGAGEQWRAEIAARLDAAGIILVLLSADYIAADPHWYEMQRALARHDSGDAWVIPIILRPCDWETSPLGKLKPLPTGGAPISTWADPDRAWVDVAKGIRAVIEQPARAPAPPRDAAQAVSSLENEIDTFSDVGALHPGVAAGLQPNQARASPPPEEPSVGGPPPNNLPRRRAVIGRSRELESLESSLKRRDADARRVVSIFGLGGAGKSTLALEYAYLHSREYPGGVFWVRAEGDPEVALCQLAQELSYIGSALLRQAVEPRSLDASAQGRARAAVLALQNLPEPSLVILDNVDSVSWREHLPAGQVQVILTTRDKRTAVGATLALDVLPASESRGLAHAIAGAPENEADADARDRVLWEVGYLPVAIEVAARAVREWFNASEQGSWTEYERHINHEMERLLDEPDLRGDYPHGVFATIDASINHCGASPAAQTLLASAALFAPDAIPSEWAATAAGLSVQTIDFVRARETLKGLGLIKIDDAAGTLSIPRLVHRRARKRAAEELAERWIGINARGASCVAEWMQRAVDPAKLAAVDVRLKHIEEALNAAERAGSEMNFIVIADRLATHQQYRARYEQARSLFVRALDKAERLTPPNEARVSTSLLNLAVLELQTGFLKKARGLLERSLTIVEATLGRDHVKVATRLVSLGDVLLKQGAPMAALSGLLRALSIVETAYGERHYKVASVLSAVAAVLGEQWDFGLAALARRYCQEAIHIFEESLGPAHPKLGTTLMNMGAMLLWSDPSAAADHLGRAHAIFNAVYGPEHPKTTRVLGLWKRTGHRDEADRNRPPADAPTNTMFPRSLALPDSEHSNFGSVVGMGHALELALITETDVVAAIGEYLGTSWHRLGVLVDSFDASAAHAVLGPHISDGAGLLSRCVRRGVLDWNASTERYEMSYSARAHARNGLEPAERYVAELAHAEHFLNVAAAAEAMFQTNGRSCLDGLVLFEREWPNISAAHHWTACHAGNDDAAARICCDLPLRAIGCLAMQQTPRDHIRWLEISLSAARKTRRRGDEATCLFYVGNTYRRLGKPYEAIERYTAALDIYRELGDRLKEAYVLAHLGAAHAAFPRDLVRARRRTGETEAGRMLQAKESFQRHLAIAQEVGDAREAIALCILSHGYRCLRLLQEDNPLCEGLLINSSVKLLCEHEGDICEATGFYEWGVAIARDMGELRISADVRETLKWAYVRIGCDVERKLENFSELWTSESSQESWPYGEHRFAAHRGSTHPGDRTRAEPHLVMLEEAMKKIKRGLIRAAEIGSCYESVVEELRAIFDLASEGDVPGVIQTIREYSAFLRAIGDPEAFRYDTRIRALESVAFVT